MTTSPGRQGEPLPPGERADGVAEGLPPGQYVARGWPVRHYGPVPAFQADTWDLLVSGATASGAERRWSWAELAALPRTTVHADLHCVTRFSVLDNAWSGVAVRTVLALAPPSPQVTHVLVWADYGYSANVRLADLDTAAAVLATHRNGEVLEPEHGAPLRLVVPHLYAWKGPKWVRGLQYLLEDRRGFWEERGYHNRADPWTEQRWSYQESEGDGPGLSAVAPQRALLRLP